jgi:hypothetical protein
LGGFIEACMATLTLAFQFGMTFDHLARHEHALDTLGPGGHW